MKTEFLLLLCYSSTAFGWLIGSRWYCCKDGSCHPNEVKCNGVRDCNGGEDEADCPCYDQFSCANGTCIELDQICDGINHCMENEDEQQENCSKFKVINPRQIERKTISILDNSTNTEQTTKSFKPFNPEKFRCKNGMHVLKRWVCDYQRDCSDGSDEDPEMCENQSCRFDEFRCGSDGECIPNNWLCDGRQDCSNGADESKCNETCRPDQFACANGRCILPHWRCDSDNDCGDGSDELNCPKKECKTDQFMCNSGKCIPQRWRCDREADCLDNSDELNCTDSGDISTSTQSTKLTTEASNVTSTEITTETTSEITTFSTE